MIRGRLILLGVVGMLLTLGSAGPVFAQANCAPRQSKVLPTPVPTCLMGLPNADGVTLPGQLASWDQFVAFEFSTPAEPRSAFIYLGDQWYDLEAGLYEEATGQEVLKWVQVARSKETGFRVLQLVKPDKIVQALKPNFKYEVLVTTAPGGEAGFNPARGFTVRVALGAPVCNFARDPDDNYQVALGFTPATPRPFDLMSFTASVSPPYSDLFDFEWRVDGQPAQSDSGTTLLVPVPALQQNPLGLHKVQVVAKGAREYPDKDQPHIPPTIGTECTFRIN